jgi:hypothetical protein
MIGNHFTCKAVLLEWRKICIEFSKRLDRDLPFYYYTSIHERFYEGQRTSFNVFVKATRNPRQLKMKQPGNLAVGQTI